MISAAFLVDGHMEKMALQKLCPGSVVRISNVNGRNVSTAAIAKRIASQCRLMHGRHHPIIVLTDREDREASALAFRDEILASIRQEGINDEVIVGVADRHMENWILADYDIVCAHLGAPYVAPSNPDGTKGKSVLRALLPGYHETTDGVELLVQCRASRMRQSPSFDAFYTATQLLDCRWLSR